MTLIENTVSQRKFRKKNNYKTQFVPQNIKYYNFNLHQLPITYLKGDLHSIISKEEGEKGRHKLHRSCKYFNLQQRKKINNDMSKLIRAKWIKNCDSHKQMLIS